MNMRVSRARLSSTLPAVVAVCAMAALLLSVPLAHAQINPVRITGTVTLEDGSPLGGVKLHFEPKAGASGGGRDMKVNKKGKFTHNFFPAGTYTITLVGDEYYLKHVAFLSKKPTGEPWEDVDSDAHPETGLPPLPLHGNSRSTIHLIAADASSRQKAVHAAAIEEASGPLRRASEAFEQGDMDAVLSVTETILDESPDVGPAHYLRGVALYRLGKLQDAAEALGKAVEIIPEQPGIFGISGMVNLDQAKKDRELGLADAAKSSFSKAADLFAKELEASPDDLALLTNRVVALEGCGRGADTVGALEALKTADPGNVSVYFSLAKLYRESGDAQKAVDTLASVPAADKDTAAAIYNLCVKLYNENDYDTVIVALDKALEIDPDFALAHHLKGYSLLAKGEQDAAIESLEKFVEMAPDHADAARDRDMIKALSGQ